MLLAAFLLPTTALAHPLGNESINHISILWILPDRVEFDLFLDFAEGPSQKYPEQIDVDNDAEETADEQKTWLMKKAGEYLPYLNLSVDGRPIRLTVAEQAHDPNTGKKMASIPGMIKVPGVAGMPTYKTLSRFVGIYPEPLAGGEHVLNYEDTTFGQYNGLKRIILEKVPAVEVLPPHPAFLDPEGTAFLYDQYDPANLPNERKVAIQFKLPNRPQPVASRPAVTDTQSPTYLASITDPRNDPSRTSASSRQAQRIVGLLQNSWGPMVFLTVTALAFVWGAAHALMPGHAKTVVAAYLISRSGKYWHAVALAVIVTITHTALVVAVGVVIWLYQESNPRLGARLQLWLGIIAGVLVAIMGLTLIWRSLTGRIAHHPHDHEHDHGHDSRSWLRKLFTHSHPHVPPEEGSGFRVQDSEGHHHHEHDHSHEHAHSHSHDPSHSHPHDHGPIQHHHDHHPDALARDYGSSGAQSAATPLTLRMLLLLGITGGIVPCPTATIILLLGIGANVVAGALYAVGIFSLGLALTLMLIGFLALSSRRIATRILSDAHQEGELSTTGRRILLELIPAISGVLVVILGLAITANYLYHLYNGRALLSWLG